MTAFPQGPTFPYGAQPTNMGLRADLIARCRALIAAKAAYEDELGSHEGGCEFVLEEDPQDVLNAMALTPVTAPVTEDEVVITGYSHGVILREIMRRLDDPDFRSRLFQRLERDGRIYSAIKVGKRLHQFLDEDFLKEFGERLKRASFADEVVKRLEVVVGHTKSDDVWRAAILDEELGEEVMKRMAGNGEFRKSMMDQLDSEGFLPQGAPDETRSVYLCSDDVFLQVFDDRMESKGFAYKVGQLLGERVVGWLSEKVK